jgi:hypothetical protein
MMRRDWFRLGTFVLHQMRGLAFGPDWALFLVFAHRGLCDEHRERAWNLGNVGIERGESIHFPVMPCSTSGFTRGRKQN